MQKKNRNRRGSRAGRGSRGGNSWRDNRRSRRGRGRTQPVVETQEDEMNFDEGDDLN